MKLFGKNICRVYEHCIMKMEEGAVGTSLPRLPEFHLRKIGLPVNPDDLSSVGTKTSVAGLSKIARANPGRCAAFVGEVAGTGVGTLWVMYRGGTHVEYKIRNVDAFVFDVFVNPAHRGHGYAGMMLRELMAYLATSGIHDAYLAVSLDNTDAIRAYEKAGLRKVGHRKFLRILKVNIPFHVL